MRRPWRIALFAPLLLWLANCAGEGSSGPADLRTANFSDLPGWSSDNQSEALSSLRQSCPKLTAADMVVPTERGRQTVTAADWRAICEAAAQVPARNATAARSFFETWFRPVAFANEARFTGYFEPEIRGSRVPSRRFTVPVYRHPPDLGTAPYLTRAEIENGALKGKGLEIAYVGDPIGLFELHVQGSGRIVLAEGGVLRLGFDGSNNQPYTALARVMADENIMPRDQASWPRIRQWLQDNPSRGRELMRRNERYIFFRDMQGQGPLGAHGVSLLAGRSLAVDPAYTPYGLPVWVETQKPIEGKPQMEAYRRLLVAQDTGSAIKGPARGDVFFGSGTSAADSAGRLNSTGHFWMLVPRK
jgi:membrane-bound lytic murein transglycosylase A